MPFLSAIWRRLGEGLHPARCVGCGMSGTFLCDRCAAEAKPSEPRCPSCAELGWPGVCARCAVRRPAFDSATVACRYMGAARDAVHALKYRHVRAIAPTLAGHMAVAVRQRRVSADAIVPMPVHAKRLRDRGYNQAALLADALGALLGLPVLAGALVRVQSGRSQVKAPGHAARWANVAYDFEPGADGTAGMRLLLVDDVLTTGSTMSAAAWALKRGGAVEVAAVAFAREER
ncbi:MAG: ComF family protein [SAR202 cluster bacterium]|nr:ComF family protein [SAR202 cluster bacterium]